MSAPKVVPDLHQKYIANTPQKVIVQNVTVFLCNLTYAVTKGVNLENYHKVYISTRVLKHSYDKRPAFEYDLFINNIHKIIKYPDRIYLDKDRRGDYCFVKNIKNEECLCVLEKRGQCMEVVTFYRVTKEKYLNNFPLVWSWRNDNIPHRNALDSGESQPTSVPQ